MSFLPALSAAIGIYQSINANNAARSRQREADKLRAEEIAQEKAYKDRMLAEFQANDAAGVYSPNEREALLTSIFERSLKKNLGESNASLVRSGSRMGDSRFDVNSKLLSQDNALRYSDAVLDNREQANQRRQSDLMRLTNPAQYSGALRSNSEYNTNRAAGYASNSDPSASLMGFLQSMNTQKKVTPEDTTPWSTAPPDQTAGVPLWERDLWKLGNLSAIRVR